MSCVSFIFLVSCFTMPVSVLFLLPVITHMCLTRMLLTFLCVFWSMSTILSLPVRHVTFRAFVPAFPVFTSVSLGFSSIIFRLWILSHSFQICFLHWTDLCWLMTCKLSLWLKKSVSSVCGAWIRSKSPSLVFLWQVRVSILSQAKRKTVSLFKKWNWVH